MQLLRTLAVAAALGALAACSGGGDAANNTDANVALEGENLDAGLNADASLNATDLNALDANATDVNAANATDVNAAGATDANETTNNSL